MKASKILAFIAMFSVSFAASAQFANSNAGISKAAEFETGYDRISVSYMYEIIGTEYRDVDDAGLNGFSIDYIHGFSVSKTRPVYIETGIGIQSGYYDEKYLQMDFKGKLTLTSVTVPVNVAYTFPLGFEFSIQPQIGIDLKYNAVGKIKIDMDGKAYDINMFNENETGSTDSKWKRFQIGGHFGANLIYHNFLVSLSFGGDYVELFKKSTTSTLKVGVGYKF